MVEDDAFDVRTAVQESRLCLFVRAIDLEVVFEFPFARQARVERLRVLVVAILMALEKAAAVLRQDHRVIAISRHAHDLDQPFLAKVSQVAGRGSAGLIVVVPEITTGDHSKGADGRERARFGAAQGVFAIAVVNDLALRSARQAHVSGECIPASRSRSRSSRSRSPSGDRDRDPAVLVRALPFVSWTASERPRVSSSRSRVRCRVGSSRHRDRGRRSRRDLHALGVLPCRSSSRES